METNSAMFEFLGFIYTDVGRMAVEFFDLSPYGACTPGRIRGKQAATLTAAVLVSSTKHEVRRVIKAAKLRWTTRKMHSKSSLPVRIELIIVHLKNGMFLEFGCLAVPTVCGTVSEHKFSNSHGTSLHSATPHLFVPNPGTGVQTRAFCHFVLLDMQAGDKAWMETWRPS